MIRSLSRLDRRWLVVIVAVAAALRVAWVLWAARPPEGLHDPSFYLLYGEQLASGNGYRLPSGEPTAYYPPGYPLSLAPFFWILYQTPLSDGGELATATALNVVWQLATIVVVYAVARPVTGRTVGAAVAAGTLALWPNLVFHTAVALTESLFLLLLVVVLHLGVSAPWAERRWETWRLVMMGLVLGAATLVRPVTLPIVPLLLVVLLVAGFGWRRALRHTAVVGLCTVAVLAPWAVRNLVVTDALTLSLNTGDNLCMSRRVGGSGGFEMPNDRCFPPRFDEIPRPASEVLRDRHGRDLALRFVREHPMEELRLVGRRLAATFEHDADGMRAIESYGRDPWLTDRQRSLLRTIANVYGLAGAVVAVPGLWLLARRSPAGLLVALTGLGMLVPPLVFFGDPRFHVPAVPVAAIAVGMVATAVWRAPPAPGVDTPSGGR